MLAITSIDYQSTTCSFVLDDSVKVNVKLFAMIREIVGYDEITVRLENAAATVGDLRAGLLSEYPTLLPLLPFSQVAVNQEVVGDDVVLNVDDEIAILPPVSGG